MTSARGSQISRPITILITIFSLSLSAYAKYSGGAGDPNDPYQITAAADLIALGEELNDYDKHFILTADIDLSCYTFDRAVIAPDVNDVPSHWGYNPFDGMPFEGVLDGDDHIILHLTITGESYLGLFGQLDSSAKVKDLGIEDANITGTDCLGSLAAINEGSINTCHSTGKVTGNEDIGGLVGDNEGNITMCYSAGVVTGSRSVGGLAGSNASDDITESITASCSTATVSGDLCVGGLVGGNGGIFEANINTSYSTGIVIGDRFVGGLVGENSSGSDGGEIIDCYSIGMVTGNDNVGGLVGRNGSLGIISSSLWDVESSGLTNMCGSQTEKGVGCDVSFGKTTAEMQDPNTFIAEGWGFVSLPDVPHGIWIEPEGGGYPMLWWQSPSGFELSVFDGGKGEPNDPYIISTTEQLNAIGHNPKLMDSHFKLIDDLDITDLHFYPIGSPDYPYCGVFDGNGHTVSNLIIEGESHLGLFGVIADGAVVKELGIVDVNITGTEGCVGGLVGLNLESTVTDCYISGTVTGGDWYVGGLVGKNVNGIITGCYSAGSTTGNNSVGGLVGYNNNGSITESYSTVLVTGGEWCIGGLVGTNSGIINMSYSTGTVRGEDYHVGGLVGKNAGRTSGLITNCYSTGAVSGTIGVGGLVGRNAYSGEDGTITNCYSTGVVIGNSDVGGLVGCNGGNVISSFWDKETSGRLGSAGGCGKTTAQMQSIRTFHDADWDFFDEEVDGSGKIWWLHANDYPHLWWEAIE